MITGRFRVVNRLGLHARAAAKLVALVTAYDCRIVIERDGRSANAKSIMGMMMLAASRGSEVVVTADGPDEEEALSTVERFFAERCGEPD